MNAHGGPAAIPIQGFCDAYGFHKSTFYRLYKKGLMPPVVKIGSASRILVDDIEQWLEDQKARSSAAITQPPTK